jgi:hypothetical protein
MLRAAEQHAGGSLNHLTAKTQQMFKLGEFNSVTD